VTQGVSLFSCAPCGERCSCDYWQPTGTNPVPKNRDEGLIPSVVIERKACAPLVPPCQVSTVRRIRPIEKPATGFLDEIDPFAIERAHLGLYRSAGRGNA
jgi:hypothetical protein